LVWPVGAAVVVVAGAAVVLAVVFGGGSGDRAAGPPSSSARPSPSPSPSGCGLRVTDSGFTDRYGAPTGVPAGQGQIEYAVVVENPCPRAAVDVQLLTEGVDGAGQPVRYDGSPGGGIGDPRSLPAIPPGGRLGVTGAINNGAGTGVATDHYDATAVAAVRATVRHVAWQPAAAATPAPDMSALGTTVGARGADGYAPVRFTLRVGRGLPGSWMSIILRDARGRIVAGEERSLTGGAADGQVVDTKVWVPVGATGLHAEIYFLHQAI
jgi:hypothetical protein